MHTIQPIDKELILNSAKETGAILSVEEHSVRGGLGSAVAEILAESNTDAAFSILGMTEFGESGDLNQLIEKYGFGAANIAKCAKEVMAKKK